MRTKKTMKVLFAGFLAMLPALIFAQSPANDHNWVSQPGMSDDFTTGILDTSKWKAMDLTSATNPCTDYGTLGVNWGGQDIWKPSNVTFNSATPPYDNGTLRLQVDGPTGAGTPTSYCGLDDNGNPTYVSGPYQCDPSQADFCCYSGGIMSKNPSYTYGYVEIRAIFPGYVDGSGIGHATKFWPAFWLYHSTCVGTPPVFLYDEIDVVDPGTVYADGKSIMGGIITEIPGGACGPTINTLYPPFSNGQVLCDNDATPTYHKYGMEWDSGKIIYYFDDVPFYELRNDPATVTTLPMTVFIDQQILGTCSTTALFDAGIIFPQYMTVDYFNYYTLRKTSCNASTLITTNAQLNTFWANAGVRSTITLGAGTVSLDPAGVSAPSNVTFRAVNGIAITGTFTVPLGTECALLPTNCD